MATISNPFSSNRRRASFTMADSFNDPPSLLQRSIVVGCPKEVKAWEGRVGLTPSSAAEYILNGHKVIIQSGAGLDSGFDDSTYVACGCSIVATIEEVYEACSMIVKVKEPQPCEYDLIREGQVIFTYFHFAANPELTQQMLAKKAVCIAYETVQAADKSLPLLVPMSEIAGRMAIHEGARYLEKHMGGRGVLLAGVPGVLPARVLVLGAGVVGINAAKIAAGIGADVVVMDINISRLRYLDEVLPANARTLYCTTENVNSEIAKADLVVGCVLIPGDAAPKLVKRSHLKTMKPGSVMVDVAIDQGGCFESSRVTSHDNPIYIEDGVIHYCVGNMPGAVSNTSAIALNNATLKYGLQIANNGWYQASVLNPEIKKGLNIVHGNVVYESIAKLFGYRYTSFEDLIREALISDNVIEKVENLNMSSALPVA